MPPESRRLQRPFMITFEPLKDRTCLNMREREEGGEERKEREAASGGGRNGKSSCFVRLFVCIARRQLVV
jgi:hypothetical protein